MGKDGSVEPLSGVRIRVLVLAEGTGDFVSYSGGDVTSDTQGEYSLALPQGVYKLVMETGGYHTAVQEVTLTRAGFVNTSFSSVKYSGLGGFFQRISDYVFAP